MRIPRLAFALSTALASAAAGPAQAPPGPKEQDKLAADFLAADATTTAGRTRQREILAALDAVPALNAAQLRDWHKKLDKLQEKGRELERTGDNWFWDDRGKKGKHGAQAEKRGRYIVGGQTQRPKGLVIAMHGGGAGSGDAGSAASGYDGPCGKLGCVMVAPEVLEKTERGWTDAGTEEFVLQLVDCALRTWKIDSDRVFFAGHSMGGYGSWTLGAHHADRLAAIAPSAGAPTPILSRDTGKEVDVSEGVIPSLRNVFVSVYQSLDDPQVPPGPNQCAVRLLAEAQKRWGGFAFDYWEVNGQGHAPPPGGHGAQLQRIADKVRKVVPERVVWQPVRAWKRQFYWLWWETPVLNAIVVADLDKAGNAVNVTCDKATDDLWVLLDERVLDLAKEVTVTVNGKQTFHGIARPSLGALLLSSEHPDSKLRFAARVPVFVRPG